MTFDWVTERILNTYDCVCIFENLMEIYDWLKQNTTEHEDADMILSVMTSHNTVNKEFQFKNAFPTSLSGVDFNVQANDVEYAQAEVSFRYDEFVIIK